MLLFSKIIKRAQLVPLLILLFGGTLLTQGKVHVILDSIYSKATDGYRKFYVILPRNYNETEERYRVLYLLHGYSGNHTDWLNKTSLIKYVSNYPLLVITPEADNSWYTNSPTFKNKNYEDYIITELIPYVERKYRVLSAKHGRAIAGLSMGGYGAVKLALKYPNFLYYVGYFSGAFNWKDLIKMDKSQISQSLKEFFGESESEHWDKNDIFVIVEKIETFNLPYFYILCGKDDTIEGLLESNREFVEKLRRKGILYEYHELPGGHDWLLWDVGINNFLKKLLTKK
ncbi:S-formylglutathione hydrolase FrmB [Candidatus Kryptonium thompsonii]|nr:S-formylglutathione hydrolase FrmB [Candidatus Kryptonium thompsoni]